MPIFVPQTDTLVDSDVAFAQFVEGDPETAAAFRRVLEVGITIEAAPTALFKFEPATNTSPQMLERPATVEIAKVAGLIDDYAGSMRSLDYLKGGES